MIQNDVLLYSQISAKSSCHQRGFLWQLFRVDVETHSQTRGGKWAQVGGLHLVPPFGARRTLQKRRSSFGPQRVQRHVEYMAGRINWCELTETEAAFEEPDGSVLGPLHKCYGCQPVFWEHSWQGDWGCLCLFCLLLESLSTYWVASPTLDVKLCAWSYSIVLCHVLLTSLEVLLFSKGRCVGRGWTWWRGEVGVLREVEGGEVTVGMYCMRKINKQTRNNSNNKNLHLPSRTLWSGRRKYRFYLFCICTCMHVYMYVAHMCAMLMGAWGWWWVSSLIILCLIHWGRVSHWTQSLLFWLAWLARLSWGSCFCLLFAGIIVGPSCPLRVLRF